MAIVTVNQGESIESALRRFKRKVMTEEIIKDAKKHAFFIPPGQKAKLKSAFFLVAFARESRLELGLLTGRDKEGMLFCVLNYLLRHHLALEPPQRAFDRLTLINSNYRHSFSAFLFIRSEATAYLTRRQRPRSSAQSLLQSFAKQSPVSVRHHDC